MVVSVPVKSRFFENSNQDEEVFPMSTRDESEKRIMTCLKKKILKVLNEENREININQLFWLVKPKGYAHTAFQMTFKNAIAVLCLDGNISLNKQLLTVKIK